MQKSSNSLAFRRKEKSAIAIYFPRVLGKAVLLSHVPKAFCEGKPNSILSMGRV
jgi:hypothetical protein